MKLLIRKILKKFHIFYFLLYNDSGGVDMENQIKILNLLNQKRQYVTLLNELVYGAIEIREKDSKKYIYLHTKEDGLQSTKYVGEYTEELYNLVLNNNIKAKTLKKSIRNIEKELNKLNYFDEDLPLDVAKNIDFARKHLVDTIYNQAILEGIATTLSEIENIINGNKVNNMIVDDILKVVNLKHAWEFILNKNVILSKTDYNILCSINKFVEEGFFYLAGSLRTTPVKIGGTSWTPELPIEADIKDNLNSILSLDIDDVQKSIKLLLYVVKSQMFIDGNKRTSVIFANHYLISKGKGLIVIPDNLVSEYKNLLIKYYESDIDDEIMNFLMNKCYRKI